MRRWFNAGDNLRDSARNHAGPPAPPCIAGTFARRRDTTLVNGGASRDQVADKPFDRNFSANKRFHGYSPPPRPPLLAATPKKGRAKMAGRGLNLISRSANSDADFSFRAAGITAVSGGQGSIGTMRIHKRPSTPLPSLRRPSAPRESPRTRSSKRYGAPRKFTMQISRCIFRSPAKTTGERHRRQKMHPAETAGQNAGRARNNYVIAGEIHRRERLGERRPRDRERRQDFHRGPAEALPAARLGETLP